jgi:hypothetical protein
MNNLLWMEKQNARDYFSLRSEEMPVALRSALDGERIRSYGQRLRDAR